MKKILLGTAAAAVLTALGTAPSLADGWCYRYYSQCYRPCVSYYSYPRVVYYTRPRVVYYTYRKVVYDTYRRVEYSTYPRSEYDDP
jgi:hypothetical protein